MYYSVKTIFAAGACAALLAGGLARAETVWKPPAEIAPKAGGEAGAAASGAENAPVAAPVSRAEKEKICNEQAAAKGLKGKAKRQFKAECLKS